MMRVDLVFGTRPEAIKLAPVARALDASGQVRLRVVATAQHRDLLDQVLADTGLVPDVDLDLMRAGGSLDDLLARLLPALGATIARDRPDVVVVQGDTATAFAGAIAAYHAGVAVTHVEAGLRSGDLTQPAPEEGYRRMISRIAALHLAPTETAAAALRAENVAAADIVVTGNSVIDALDWTCRRLRAGPALGAAVDAVIDRLEGRRIVALTAHRRENIGAGFAGIAVAVARLAARGDVAILAPTHPNPAIAAQLLPALADINAFVPLPALAYPAFVRLLERATLILSDSGGVQEEAPALGRPLLILRETSERPEAIAAGAATLVGTDPDRIVAAASRLLDDPAHHAAIAVPRYPFGRPGAAARCVGAILARFGDQDASAGSRSPRPTP